MTRQRSITIVLPMFLRVPVGGYLVAFEYANHFAQAGYRVDLILPRNLEVLDGRKPSLKRRLWPLKTRALSWPLIPWFQLHKDVRIHLMVDWTPATIPDADAILATAFETAGPVAALPDSKGRKFYLVQHFETWAATPEEIGATYRLPFTVIAISHWLEGIVRHHGASTVAHIPNGLDHALFRETGAPRNPRSIATLYHDQAFKGVPDALEALARLHEEAADVAVTMFGVPVLGSEVPPWISYLRQPPREALVDLFNRSGIYVSASIAEGWALPPAEAMSCGALFVGTDSGGCRDFAEPDVTALLSPPNDPEALLQNLRRALSGGPAIEAIRRRGTERVRQFTWADSGRRFQALVEAA